ncbi:MULTISPECIES: hypothetical protein [unclassified Bartonella]|uniref:hypothetical protein n=1 Tax=unclassified Bartonella TaxID=2645622 RepID=UPI0035D0842F
MFRRIGTTGSFWPLLCCAVFGGAMKVPHDGEVAGQVLFHWRGNGPCGTFVH